MSVPRLHVVTDEAVLARPDFPLVAGVLLDGFGAALALHLRGHGTTAATLTRLARALAPVARGAGSVLLINDRVDVALAVGCGAQIGRRSIPVAVARELLGPDVALGYSAHAVEEAAAAGADGAGFVIAGTVWPSPSHPDRPGAGPALVTSMAAVSAVPVLAIGGVTPERTPAALQAGAHGVAVLSSVWDAADPAHAVGRYVDALSAVSR